MRAAVLTVAALALAGCRTCPDVKPPEIVRVVVPQMVPVPAELTQPTQVPAKRDNSVGEAVRLANTRKVALEQCNADKASIRALGEEQTP